MFTMHSTYVFLLAYILAAALAAPKSVPYYQTLTSEQTKRLASWDLSIAEQNIWQLSGQTQGDMILTPDQRNGLISPWFRWPNNELPYELDQMFNPNQANEIHSAVRAFAAKTCVNVRPRTNADTDYVYVTGDNTGCWSYVGRLGGRQLLNLQINGCLEDFIIQHEFLHALGFFHEHSSTNRDDYVTIMWNNIIEDMAYNFDKYEADYISSYGQPYDYESVMHYDAYAFTAIGQPTIVPHDPRYLNIIGRAPGMSQIDINKLNAMYC